MLKYKLNWGIYANSSILKRPKVDYEDARISIEDRGFLFGDGLYEVVHVYKGRFFHLDRHLARLEQGAKEIYLNLDFGLNNLANICRKAAKRADMTMPRYIFR